MRGKWRWVAGCEEGGACGKNKNPLNHKQNTKNHKIKNLPLPPIHSPTTLSAFSSEPTCPT